jgi:hypothetical protein
MISHPAYSPLTKGVKKSMPQKKGRFNRIEVLPGAQYNNLADGCGIGQRGRIFGGK